MLRRLSIVVTSLAAVSAWGQSAISARAGMVNHVEGQVLLDGQPVDLQFGQFPRVNDQQTLSTQDGRAEVLLTPGAFLRLDENSSFQMLSSHLSDTAVEILSGSAILEVDEFLKDNAITIRFKNGTVSLKKHGLYRFDAEWARMRVYDGDAEVIVNERNIQARKGRQVVFGETLVASSFDTSDTDAFYRWASRRAEYISAANISSARTAGSNGLLSNYGGMYPGYGTWAWNPWFGMYTYLPGGGFGYSPFGWDLFSPYTVWYAYAPYSYGGGASAYPGLGRVNATSNTNSEANALNAARNNPPSASNYSGSSGDTGPRMGSGGGISGSGGGGAAMSHGGMGGGGRR